MQELSKVYTDINLALITNPITGDISTLYNENCIKRSLLHLMLMEKWDVPFHPEISSGLQDSLFELAGDITRNNIRSNIEWIIKQYEPRILVKDINVELSQAQDAYAITIQFLVKNILKEDTINFFLSRIR